jgi:hypothetical protein
MNGKKEEERERKERKMLKRGKKFHWFRTTPRSERERETILMKAKSLQAIYTKKTLLWLMIHCHFGAADIFQVIIVIIGVLLAPLSPVPVVDSIHPGKLFMSVCLCVFVCVGRRFIYTLAIDNTISLILWLFGSRFHDLCAKIQINLTKWLPIEQTQCHIYSQKKEESPSVVREIKILPEARAVVGLARAHAREGESCTARANTKII